MSRGRSWGHYVVPVLEAEIAKEESTKYPWRHHCRVARKCTQRTAYIVGYSYISGRRGNTSTRDQVACAEHAQRFAAKHQLPFPPTAEPVGIYGARPTVTLGPMVLLAESQPPAATSRRGEL